MLKISLALLLLLSSNSYHVDGEIVSSMRHRGGIARLLGLDGEQIKEVWIRRDGKFQFRNIPEGNYYVIVTMDKGRDVRRSIEVRPRFSDKDRRIPLQIDMREAMRDRARYEVSVTKLFVPQAARREFYKAVRAGSDLERAQRHLERALEIAPDFDEALNNLGTIYIRNGRRDEAIALFERALEVNPESFFARVNLGGVLIWKRDLERALELNLAAMKLRPEDGLSRAQAGIALFFMHQYEEAVPYLEEARRLDPFNPIGPSLYLARVHEALGRHSKAVEEYTQFLEQHPAHPLTHFARARVRTLGQQAAELN